MKLDLEEVCQFGVHLSMKVWVASDKDPDMLGSFSMWLGVNDVPDIASIQQSIDRGLAQVREQLRDKTLHVAKKSEGNHDVWGVPMHFPVCDWPPAEVTTAKPEETPGVPQCHSRPK